MGALGRRREATTSGRTVCLCSQFLRACDDDRLSDLAVGSCLLSDRISWQLKQLAVDVFSWAVETVRGSETVNSPSTPNSPAQVALIPWPDTF